MMETVQLKVLIVEDCETDYELEVRALRKSGFEAVPRRVASEADLREALASAEWQIVICDYSLPSLDGLRAQKIVRAVCQDLPLIIVSGVINEEQAVDAMRAGAQDYVFKGNLARLGPAVRRELEDADLRRRSRAAEVKLRKVEDRFRIAAMTSNDLIFEWDVEQNIDYFGDVETMLGYEPGEFPRTVGGWAEALYPEDRKRVLEALRASVESGAPYHVEYRILGKNGAIFWWSARGAISQPAEGTPVRFIGTITDITARVLREEELRQRNEELERFTYTVSHDLRSPLVTIQTFVGYLRQDLAVGDTQAVAADMEYIHGGASKMARLIDYLLDISRVGRVVNPPTNLSVRKLVGEVLASMAGQILERGVTITVDESEVVLSADCVRLAEIWQNLIENALKYMGDQPSPQLWIGVEGSGRECVFYVRDNGMGIEARFLERIFNLFEKLDRASGGFGFGLALVKRIVELYGGRVWAESEGLGRGSCFRFTLPLTVSGPREAN